MAIRSSRPATASPSSISYFDTSEHADESTRLASNWVREQKLETVLNAPKITSGEVVVRVSELVQGVTASRPLTVVRGRFGGPSLYLEVLLGPLVRFPRGELLLGRLELDQRW